MKLLVINGPNMNLLGLRQPALYGSRSYDSLVEDIRSYCANKGIDVTFFQSNHEGNIIDAIQQAYRVFDGLIINPAGFSHTSIAIADAIAAVGIPAVEVHLTDITVREAYRRISYTSEVCMKTIAGKGFDGYLQAVDALLAQTEE